MEDDGVVDGGGGDMILRIGGKRTGSSRCTENDHDRRVGCDDAGHGKSILSRRLALLAGRYACCCFSCCCCCCCVVGQYQLAVEDNDDEEDDVNSVGESSSCAKDALRLREPFLCLLV